MGPWQFSESVSSGICPLSLLNDFSILDILHVLHVEDHDWSSQYVYVVDIQLWIRSCITSICWDQVHINSDKKPPASIFTWEPLALWAFHDTMMINEDELNVCHNFRGFRPGTARFNAFPLQYIRISWWQKLHWNKEVKIVKGRRGAWSETKESQCAVLCLKPTVAKTC